MGDAPATAAAADGVPQLHYSGFMVCGPKPLWLVATRGGLVAHPMETQRVGAVDAFCGFHNVDCPHGFIAATLRQDMLVCTLPLQVQRGEGERGARGWGVGGGGWGPSGGG